MLLVFVLVTFGEIDFGLEVTNLKYQFSGENEVLNEQVISKLLENTYIHKWWVACVCQENIQF